MPGRALGLCPWLEVRMSTQAYTYGMGVVGEGHGGWVLLPPKCKPWAGAEFASHMQSCWPGWSCPPPRCRSQATPMTYGLGHRESHPHPPYCWDKSLHSTLQASQISASFHSYSSPNQPQSVAFPSTRPSASPGLQHIIRGYFRSHREI